MRVDKLKKWTDFRDELAAISRAIAVAQSQPTPMDIGAVGKGEIRQGWQGIEGSCQSKQFDSAIMFQVRKH